MYADRVKELLNQVALLKRRSGTDAFNKPDYSEDVFIAVRKEGKNKLVRDILGNEVVSNTTVFCTVPVKPNDLIDEAVVISVSEMVEKDGTICGYEVFL